MEDTKADAVLEEMLAGVKEHSSESQVGTVVHKGDGDVPPMIISSISSGGKVQVYDTKTGEMSWVLYNKDTGGMLRGILKRKRPDGSRIFTLAKPSIEPVRGTLKCLLHPDVIDRERYNTMGLPVCKKSNLTAPYMVEKHMKNRHPSAWAILDKEKQDKEKAEDRSFQRALYEAVGSKAVDKTPEAPLYISKKDKAK